MCVHTADSYVATANAARCSAQLLDSSNAGTPAPPSMLLSNCLLDGNRAVIDGGAVSLLAGAVTLSSGAVSSNAAGGDGGGVSVKVRLHITLRACWPVLTT